ncbi:MAG: type II secretion system F family protein [Sphingomonadaceae bacterium]
MGIVPTMMIALGVFATLALLMFAFMGPSVGKAQSRRLSAVKARHGASTTTLMEAQIRKISTKRATRIDGIAQSLIPNPALMRLRLSKTGKDWKLSGYLIATVSIAICVAALLYFRSAPIWLSLAGGSAIGLCIPHFVVGYLINARLKDFIKKLPDAIELIVRGLRSGLPIGETLGIVSTEIPGSIGVEFRGVIDRVRIGRTLDAALQETADRIGTPEFQFFCITLAIQRETGGNLAETLSNLAHVLRNRAQMKLKISAMSSESKASAYIIGSLPFIVFILIWFINNKYMAKFFTDSRLIIAGLGGMVWMSIGAFIMAQMINFEI